MLLSSEQQRGFRTPNRDTGNRFHAHPRMSRSALLILPTQVGAVLSERR
jgi:hypothetical protein